MAKYIRASVRFEALVQIDDHQSLFRLAEMVPAIKDKLLSEVKRNVAARAKGLTVDSLTFEEIIMPTPSNKKEDSDE